MFKSNNKPLNYIHQVAPKFIFYMSMHILLQPEISVCVWSRLFPWFLLVWLTAGLRPWPNEWRQMSVMCRLPAGQTTFAISNSTQPCTRTCCEINYAFNFYQMRKCPSGFVAENLERCVKKHRWENTYICLVEGLILLLSFIKKQYISHCTLLIVLYWENVDSDPPFVLPAWGDISLFNPSLCCLQPRESHLLLLLWLKALFYIDDVTALQISWQWLCRSVSSFIWCCTPLN